MGVIAVDNKSIITPILVPSISSFETQLKPFAALHLQHTLGEPISLVSAYDVRRLGTDFNKLCQEFRKSSVLLLDSGGYEHSHIARYVDSEISPWTFDNFRSVCISETYDFIFSFDYFWRDQRETETASDFTLRLAEHLFSSHNFIKPEKLIPVLHLHTRHSETHRLNDEDILALVEKICAQNKSQFIAIPERELGTGLVERFRLTRKICEILQSANKGVGLHVLGCGNLLSFAFLATAGARMVDGLEWYRTFVADNFHLHHFHQEPLFNTSAKKAGNPIGELVLSQNFPYRIKVAALNLMSLQAFSSKLNSSLETRSVDQMVGQLFGEKAGATLRALNA